MSDATHKSIQVLMVEDSRDDVFLTREALAETQLEIKLDVVADGIEAMDYLHQAGPYDRAPRPDLILLDLNMPRKDGREVLAEIKADETLKSIPVVVLTTSQAEDDVMNAYRLQANSYVTKPVDLDQFIRVVGTIEKFWFTIAKLPPQKAPQRKT